MSSKLFIHIHPDFPGRRVYEKNNISQDLKGHCWVLDPYGEKKSVWTCGRIHYVDLRAIFAPEDTCVLSRIHFTIQYHEINKELKEGRFRIYPGGLYINSDKTTEYNISTIGVWVFDGDVWEKVPSEGLDICNYANNRIWLGINDQSGNAGLVISDSENPLPINYWEKMAWPEISFSIRKKISRQDKIKLETNTLDQMFYNDPPSNQWELAAFFGGLISRTPRSMQDFLWKLISLGGIGFLIFTGIKYGGEILLEKEKHKPYYIYPPREHQYPVPDKK